MRSKCAVFALFVSMVWASSSSGATHLSKDVLAGLVVQFFSESIRANYVAYGHEELLEVIPRLLAPDDWKPGIAQAGTASCIEILIPGDERHYVLLYYTQYGGDLFWRLVGSNSSGGFDLLQDGEGWYGLANLAVMQAWQTDLDSDGIPEVLILSGEPHDMSCCHVFAWRNGRLVRISPAEMKVAPKGDTVVIGPLCNSVDGLGIHLEDLDGDRKAEIIVGSDMESIWTPDAEGGENRTWKKTTPIRVFHQVNGVYEFWKEIPADDPFPISVPSIALFHPATVPFFELSQFEEGRLTGKGKSGGEGEGLRVFVSHPAGQASVDDFETNAFVYDGQGLTFKKRWSNAKQPDTSAANSEWGGCPIRQVPCAKDDKPKGSGGAGEENACEHWNFSPENPFFPSADKKMEYHFVAPYLELRLPKAAVYPYLYRAALDAFTKDPGRTEYFIEVPISGRMKNGKLAAISTMVCVKRTGDCEKPYSQLPAKPGTGVAK